MRRRFENINTVAGGKIPVFACSISAPTTTWRNPVPILGCRYRSNGATMAASYVLDEINNSIVRYQILDNISRLTLMKDR